MKEELVNKVIQELKEGGPGSGSWDGPGNPRYLYKLNLEQAREWKEKYRLKSPIYSAGGKLGAGIKTTTGQEALLKLSEDPNPRVRHSVAKNPNTPAEALDKLSTEKSLVTRIAVVDNPNVTREILEKIAKGDVEEFVRNRAKGKLKATLLPSETKVKERVREGGPGSGSWEGPNDPRFAKGLSQVKQEVDELSGLSQTEKYGIASNPNTTSETLDKLSGDKDKDVRFRVADNPNTTPETLDKLSRDEVEHVRFRVASNLNTTPETLDKLSGDKEEDVRQEVASNPNTTSETLDKLSGDKEEDVRQEVASNPNTTSETLDKLSRDEVEHVRFRVAGNPNTTPETLDKLSGDKDKDVRFRVTDNPNTTPETLDKLSGDKVEDVRLNGFLTKDYKKNEDVIREGKVDKIQFSEEARSYIKSIDGEMVTAEALSRFNDKVYNALGVKDTHTKLRGEWLESSQSTGGYALQEGMRNKGWSDTVNSIVSPGTRREALSYLEKNKETVEKYLDVSYELNQKYLDLAFPDKESFVLYRGTSQKEVKGGEEVEISQNPLSSYTLKKSVAKLFAKKGEGVVIKTTIPKKDIFSSFFINSHSGFEAEFMVMGKKGRIGVVA